MKLINGWEAFHRGPWNAVLSIPHGNPSADTLDWFNINQLIDLADEQTMALWDIVAQELGPMEALL